MRLIVLGAEGQLGMELVDAAREAGVAVTGVTRLECDIAVPGAVEQILDRHRADAVINCAAWTRVDAAESHVAEAEAINATAPGWIASACGARGVRLCHISTDYVFDGTATSPIAEEAATNPTSVYGRTKLAGELAVRERCPDHLIVRTSWLYGRDGPNFVLTMLRLAGELRQLRVVADQRGTPTWTGHLAPALLRLLEIAPAGTYHLTNSGDTTWHGLASATFAARGIDVDVVPITTDEYPTPAPRPRYSVLDNSAWRRMGEEPLPPWEEGLRAYLR